MPVIRDWHSCINDKVIQESAVTGRDCTYALKLIGKTMSARQRWAICHYAFKA